MSALMQTYARLPVTFSHGEGVYLFDTEGNRYLDGIGGIAVNSLGHAHPAVTEAITRQAGRLLHTSNLYHIEVQEALGRRLCGTAGMESCFFCNSGAEANEAAIKLMRLYGHQRDIEEPVIVVMEGAFHGRTLATLTATGNRRIQQGFGPLVPGFQRVPFNDLEALHRLAAQYDNIVGVMLEPIQGEGGILPADLEYLRAVRRLCDDKSWLLALDEVQTGNGRTGHYFAYQGMGVVPDVVTTAKGLGNGVPIGACLATGHAAGVFGAGDHGSTYGGNPLACAAGLAVVETITDCDLCANATAMEQVIRETLEQELASGGQRYEVRGRGLMLGIEPEGGCDGIVQRGLHAGLLLNVTAGRTLRLLPPLIIEADQARELARGVAELIKSV